MLKQVEKSHYQFGRYVNKRRWMSMWCQLDEVSKLQPVNVLEIGPGPGIFKAVANSIGLKVETLDIDPELKPDHVASVFQMPFGDGSYDVVCAFQMLEHLPFEDSCKAFREMTRVAKNHVVISLPDAQARWPMSIYIPKFGQWSFSIPKPTLGKKPHVFDGEHYWEINKQGYSVDQVLESLVQECAIDLVKTYRVSENPYHRFFVFSVR